MTTSSSSSNGRSVVLVDAVRTPFMRAGTAYFELTGYDLARSVLQDLMVRTNLEPTKLERVVMGTVLQNPSNSNIARDASLAAGIPITVPACTVTMACISANLATTTVADSIRVGQCDIAIAGGVESLSDVPPQFSKDMRERLFKAQKVKNPLQYRKLLAGISPSDLLPKAPGIVEFSSGESMGESADKLAAMFDVSRHAQDEYALRSHQGAAQATHAGKYDEQIAPTALEPDYKLYKHDNTIREDTSMEKLEKLSPVFVRPFGTVTAGNSSPLTDGASASLIMAEDTAKALGYKPKARLKDYVYVAQSPSEELLLGPAYAVPKLLDRNDMTLDDIKVFEIHEAFAGQVLAVLAALESDTFAKETLGRDKKVGSLDMDYVNPWGGSISLGHPFGATGTRLLATAADRMVDEDQEISLVTACAAGGLGHAILLERC